MVYAELVSRINAAAAKHEGIVLSARDTDNLEYFLDQLDAKKKAEGFDERDFFNECVEAGTRETFGD